MRLLSRMSLPFALCALGLAGPAVGAANAEGQSGAVGHVYLNDNTAGANTIAAFDRHVDGSLTPLAGSPFPAGGAGAGHGLGSQGAIQLTGDGRYLLAVDAGSNQVSVLAVHGDGSLTQVPGSPFASGGIDPVSVADHGHTVYVANAGTGGSDYAGFTLTPSGRLVPISGSTIPLPDGSAPGG